MACINGVPRRPRCWGKGHQPERRARFSASKIWSKVRAGWPMVHPAGVEPATSGTANQRSIQLSYGCYGALGRNRTYINGLEVRRSIH